MILGGGSLTTESLAVNGSFGFSAGTLTLTNSSVTLGGPTLPSHFTLNGGCSLNVSGTTTLPASSLLTLDGGSLSTSAINNSSGGTLAFNSGGLQLNNSDLVMDGSLLPTSLTLSSDRAGRLGHDHAADRILAQRQWRHFLHRRDCWPRNLRFQ